jgi:uncharacterized protein (UPF0297 family)
MEIYDFSGWATRNDLTCSDRRVIRKDAFKHNDGQQVPLVWNHQHNDPNEVLGHALLKNMEEGVYAYCKFNDTESGKTAKLLVQHGDVNALSIYANQLKQQGNNVIHGNIREVSLVLAGANPGAFIDSVIKHGEECDEEAVIFTGENISLFHADDNADEGETVADVMKTLTEKQMRAVSYIVGQALGGEDDDDEDEVQHSDEESDDAEGETIADIIKTLSEKQMKAVSYIVGQALEHGDTEEDDEDEEIKHSEGGNEMKRNVFDKETQNKNVLTHSAQEEILTMAKNSSVGTLKNAMAMYAEKNDLQHADFVDEDGNEAIETLFPDYKLVYPGAPELLERDQSWVGYVMNKIHKSPISRIRTRQADARIAELRAKGYQKKGDQKTLGGKIKLLSRTTDPQTVYRKDELHRDDIIDITEFDVVEYKYKIMRHNLEEELALAALVGDGREDGDPDKIHEDHIRSIWHDDELYCIHADVDIAAAKAELQGTDTAAHFGDNYIYAEAIITAALYSREKFKGSGTPDLFCTPHLVNVMLLARDLNGRRIYSSKADLAAALNVNSIHTVEQFEGLERTTEDGQKKALLGLFVNLTDYQFGSTKGGEITRFSQFDIDFNKEKYLIETRLSGALTRVYSAIALEEPVV